MSVIIKGMADLQGVLNNFAFDLDKAVDDAVKVTAFKVQQSAITAIRTPSVGTHVTRYTGEGNPYAHVASKPGEAPNTDTGRLIGSILVDHHKGDKVAFVGTNLEYGFFLETVHNRPWLEPAKDEQVKSFSENVTRAIDIQIKKAGK
tara:strand:- start:3032 stop:3472 length:441 start_codon:yes stop_codon:yes gene_type:complete